MGGNNTALGRIEKPWGVNVTSASDKYLYFDTANHIKRVTCTVRISASLGDYTSPPRTVAVLYNNANVNATLVMQQNATHDGAVAGNPSITLSK